VSLAFIVCLAGTLEAGALGTAPGIALENAQI
jgi:hypothetical protein